MGREYEANLRYMFSGNTLATLALGLLLVLLLPLTAAAADDRATADAAAVRGLAAVDSLLQVPAAAQAVATARALWATWAKNPIYGWQIEGRLGLALLLSGEAAAALPHLENVVLRHPRQPDHHRNLGSALLQLGRRGRALSEYAVAVELAPTDADLRREYGQLLLSFGDDGAAERELLLAREMGGAGPELDQALASLYLLQKEFGRAVPVLRRVYAAAPRPDTRRTLVAAMAQAGADTLLRDFLAATPPAVRTADEWRLLVEAEGRLGGQEHALRAVRRLSDPPPNAAAAAYARDDRFWGQVALNLLAAGAYADGLRAVDQAIKLAPDDVVYRNNRVVLLTRLGRDGAARAEWEKVLALDPSRARTSR